MLRLRFIGAFILACTIALSYLYYVAQTICPVPVTYELGTIDERFNLSRSEAEQTIAAAAAIWESATQQDLFVAADKAAVTINFVYDERQALTDAELAERGRLETTAGINEELQAEYDELIAHYNERQVAYERQVAEYDRDLATFNDRVDRYNNEGGAPAAVFTELETERERLAALRTTLNDEAATLNELVTKINRLSEEGNELITTYNQQIERYNDTFSTHREFTQGTYRSSGNIDIYTFADKAELELVLAHELGHALSIDHVAGTESIMYFVLGEQPEDLVLSEQDLAAFMTVCGERTFWDTIRLGFTTLVHNH